MRKRTVSYTVRVLLVILAGFLWLVLASSDDDGPEWSGVSHVDGRP